MTKNFIKNCPKKMSRSKEIFLKENVLFSTEEFKHKNYDRNQNCSENKTKTNIFRQFHLHWRQEKNEEREKCHQERQKQKNC